MKRATPRAGGGLLIREWQHCLQARHIVFRNRYVTVGNLAFTYWNLGRHADALPLEERALAITETTLGPDHPDTATRLNNLATTYRDLGRAAEALPLQQRALAISEMALGPDHPDTASGWATSPSRTGTLAATPTPSPWRSGRWPSPRRPWDPTSPAQPPG